jgi:hypothetical protein
VSSINRHRNTDLDSLERSLKLLPPEHVRLIESVMRGENYNALPASDRAALERSMNLLPVEHLRLIVNAIRPGGGAKPEQDISEEFDDEIDQIEREIDAGMHDDIDEHTVEVLAHRTLTRVNRLLDQYNPIDAALNAPSELVFDDDDDDEELD